MYIFQGEMWVMNLTSAYEFVLISDKNDIHIVDHRKPSTARLKGQLQGPLWTGRKCTNYFMTQIYGNNLSVSGLFEGLHDAYFCDHYLLNYFFLSVKYFVYKS